MESRPPFFYDYINRDWGMQSPSTVHCKNTCLSTMFQRYLFQRAMSVFKWKLPEEINPYYFKWCINTFGFIGLFNTKQFGHCAMFGGFEGYDLYYYPKYMLFNSPVFEKTIKREINKDCVLLNLKGDFTGFWDLTSFYADQLALLFEDAGVSMVNMKLTNVFACDNKSAAESFKRMFDHIATGEPANFVDRNLFNDDGTPRWLNFQNSLSENYVIDKLLVDVRKIINLFDIEIGIPSINTEKKERMVVSEAEGTYDEARSRAEMWLEDLKKECKKAKKLLDFDIDVEFRSKKGDENGSQSKPVNMGSVPVR